MERGTQELSVWRRAGSLLCGLVSGDYRAGRLVREVISGEYMGAGANLVRWDGRDGDASIVGEDLYLVVVEALGRREVKTVSVVR